MVIAHAFYEEALGLVYDPSVRTGQKKGVGVSWLNIGDQQVCTPRQLLSALVAAPRKARACQPQLGVQFHIDDNEDVSRTPGPVRLQLPSLDRVQPQLQSSSSKFSGTQFHFEADAHLKHIAVTDPWGQVFDIRQAESSDALTGGRIDSLVMPCHQGTAAAIALFYKLMLEVCLHQHVMTADVHSMKLSHCTVDAQKQPVSGELTCIVYTSCLPARSAFTASQ